jgi:Fe-S-cluster-containing hydrogenase component 2/CRP-like cAMP-binding protein
VSQTVIAIAGLNTGSQTPVDERLRHAGAIHLTIDGVSVAANPDMTILEAARHNGIAIPTLCHQPNQRPVAVCRVCSVDCGERSFTAACARPVEEGMVVRTNTDKVRSARRVLVELLLSDHPSPCERQRRSGDCELETLGIREGIFESRFERREEVRAKDNSSAAIAVDHEACIGCDRCIRACNEVRHNNVLGRKGKGYEVGIAFDLNDPMGDSSCISCGECMVSCPTGALTNKTVVPSELPDGKAVDTSFVKQLPYFEGISSTFLELNRNAIVLRRFKAGEAISREGEYGSTAFLILQGEAEMFLHTMGNKPKESAIKQGALSRWMASLTGDSRHGELNVEPIGIGAAISRESVKLGVGDLFGETSCLNHYPRSESVRAVTDCVALEMLRNVIDMLVQRNGEFRKLLDTNYRERALRTFLRSTELFSGATDGFLEALKPQVNLARARKNDVIFRQGSENGSFYLVRNGFVRVSEQREGGETVLEYVGPRQYFGMERTSERAVTATALGHVELIRIDETRFDALLAEFPKDNQNVAAAGHRPAPARPSGLPGAPLQQFLTQGLMEANSALILNLEKCTRCDACVRACADAHDGVTRLVREGMRFENYLVATSCRQCRDPLCMVGCPVGSIRRKTSMEIQIEDWCIGCGLCASNCPYGSIHMQPVTQSQGEGLGDSLRAVVKHKAVACDLCAGLEEPSCVYACPHDAAQRVDAGKFFRILPGAAMHSEKVK